MRRQETFIMNYAGKILEGIGIVGAVITICFDKIARDVSITLGWLQVLGILGFVAIALFGVAVDKFLKTVKELLE